MSIGIYIRTSTEEQNPENQLTQIEEMAGKDYELFKDQQSAYKDTTKREGFNELRKKIRQRKITTLYVWDFDRIYRNRIRFKEFLEFLKVYKCKLYSYNQRWMEDINSIPEPWGEMVSDMLVQIFGYIAEEESSLKGKRVRQAIRQRVDGAYSYKGNKWGRKKLSSFKKNKIIELRKEKLSIRTIAKHLNLSHGVVHKYLQEITPKKQLNGGSPQLTN